jgi:hypothetical protein
MIYPCLTPLLKLGLSRKIHRAERKTKVIEAIRQEVGIDISGEHPKSVEQFRGEFVTVLIKKYGGRQNNSVHDGTEG